MKHFSDYRNRLKSQELSDEIAKKCQSEDNDALPEEPHYDAKKKTTHPHDSRDDYEEEASPTKKSGGGSSQVS